MELAPVPAITGTRPAACSTVDSDQLAVLVDIDRRRFAGGADDDDAIRALAHMPVDQAAQGIQIEAAVLVHGRDDGDNGSGNHGLCQQEDNLRIVTEGSLWRKGAW